jgi:hypothetical protein
MGALTLLRGNGEPPAARAALVSLLDRIRDTERRLNILQAGRARLEGELGRAAEAKLELRELVEADAVTLLDRIRAGGQWALSAFGNSRARELSAALSESRIQAEVGGRALDGAAEEIAQIEREIADMKAQKHARVRDVLIESADGIRADALIAIDDLKQALVALSALDCVTAVSDGSYSPSRRTAIDIPGLGGLPAQPMVLPVGAVKRAQSVWAEFAAELESSPLASVDDLVFPHVIGNEDQGNIVYSELSTVERRIVDLEHASLGVN